MTENCWFHSSTQNTCKDPNWNIQSHQTHNGQVSYSPTDAKEASCIGFPVLLVR